VLSAWVLAWAARQLSRLPLGGGKSRAENRRASLNMSGVVVDRGRRNPARGSGVGGVR